jgi:hypothetical protein
MMPGLASGSLNVAVDTGALKNDTTGSSNIAIGTLALSNNKSGSNNVATGVEALHVNTIGHDNVATGRFALLSNTSGLDNTASGSEALFENTTGSSNLADGFQALINNTTGSSNIAFGKRAGQNLTTGSNNIDISNDGVAGETGTTRIGTAGTQAKAFVAGVNGVSVPGPACTVKANAEGQLGCAGTETGGAIATFASKTKAVASGNCLAYTGMAPAGTGPCPAATSGFSTTALLAGPTPAGGATVSNLYADSNAAVTGTDTVLVAVTDNTTGATLLTCTLTSSSPKSCANASGGGAVAAGDNIEVKITATGMSGTSKMWRVTFRF